MSVRDNLKKHRPQLKKVEWNGTTFYVQGMSGKDRSEYTARVKKAEANGGFKNEYAFAMAVRDENGKLEYDMDSPDDIAEISQLDGSLIDFAVIEYLKASGLTRKSLEEAEKN